MIETNLRERYDRRKLFSYSPNLSLENNDKDKSDIATKIDILEQRPKKLTFSDLYRKLNLQRDFYLINEKANMANKWSKYVVMATAEKEKSNQNNTDLKLEEFVEPSSSADEIILLKEGIYLSIS
jgi:hypothetical protein